MRPHPSAVENGWDMNMLLQRLICLGWSLSLLSVPVLLSAQEQQTFSTPEQAAEDPDFPLQGEYVSRTAPLDPETDAEAAKGMQAVALGEGLFRIVIYNGGLPGAGWDQKPPRVIEEDDADGLQDLIDALNLVKTERKSPTLEAVPPRAVRSELPPQRGRQPGAEAPHEPREGPPAGAVVLFDGTRETFEQHWKEGVRMTEDGLLMEGATSVETFRDFTAHIEFRTPFMPHARGQARGNSGAYFQGRYEAQILDSFGLEGKHNETGGIYEIRDPDLNMCFPPLVWQTYDVDFVSARWDEDGNKLSNARMTVRLNGVVVHRDVEVPRATRAAPLEETPEPGPLYLQDHGNPVRFRNIWIVPRDADREARRPCIPGFERFHALSDDPLEGGLLLAGELGCINCHRSDEEAIHRFAPKQAPILSDVGQRVRPEWMMQFLADPQSIKPGTTMPSLFSGWEEGERNEAVLALVNFLASTGRPADRAPDTLAARRGAKLYREIGCLACHAPRDGKAQVSQATTVPLEGVEEKYTVPSLSEFLKTPHAVRPSGRMPALHLNDNEAGELAQYLLSPATRALAPNVRYEVYHGEWSQLPDFDALEPVKTGECAGFDLSVAEREDHFGIRFEGYLRFPGRGSYTMSLGSDDGSALYVNGLKIIDNDGIHAHTVEEGRARPGEGIHHVRIDYFERTGEQSLTLEMRGGGFPRQDVSTLLTLSPDGVPPVAVEETDETDNPLAFRRDESLIERGRELFVSLGCANCHEMQRDGKRIEPGLSPRPLHEVVRSDESKLSGCLAEAPGSSSERPVPDFALSPAQQRALAAIHRVTTEKAEDSPVRSEESELHRGMAAFNCYACHARGELGGPEIDRNPLFLTTQHEMGDEGRIPPPLDGVGDKLRDDWLKRVLTDGATDRPYMRTRMPKFGPAAAPLGERFVQLDRIEESRLAEFDEPEHRVKSAGRQMTGEGGLACIKCHTFGSHQATGIQAISLTGMTRRIREDWFLRYLYEPARYRPGTRMPTGFPEGKAVVRDIYDGDPHKQISAIWTYLTDGDKAGIPDGLIAEMIELVPEDRPIIHRNFIEGLTTRGIAVGYPEKAHLAWDAEDLCLKLIWHGRFLDASRHWSARGQGQQPPLGDHVLHVEPTVPVARLESRETPWPSESPRDLPEYRFLGYHLNERGQPAFAYGTPVGEVLDFPEPRRTVSSERPIQGHRQSGAEAPDKPREAPVARNEEEGTFRRVLSFHLDPGEENGYFRAAVGKKIERTGESYRVDDALTVRVSGGGEPFLRESAGRMELLVPLIFDGKANIVQELNW
jgi:mono/diheme cytochrome c family protein